MSKDRVEWRARERELQAQYAGWPVRAWALAARHARSLDRAGGR